MKNEGIGLLRVMGFALVISVVFNSTMDYGFFKDWFTVFTGILGILYISQIILIFIPVMEKILKEK